ncbi:MAG: hypothetical protein AB8G22_25380 [Saprospiraceae bacterium]
MLNKYFSFFCLIGLFLWSCQSDTNVTAPNVEDIELDVKIKRFEQELFSLDTTNIEQGLAGQLEELKSEYPDFYEVFTQKILVEEAMVAEDEAQVIGEFITHPNVRKLYDTTQVEFANIELIEDDLTQAFKYYKYHFPDKPVPEVVSFLSEYVIGTFTYGDSLLAIGWDFFLGEDYAYDPRIFPQYIQQSMDKDHLVAKSIEAVSSNLVGAAEGKRMLDQMINNGKILYLKKMMLPAIPDSIIMEYTPQQMQWVRENEREVWAYLLREDLLYSTRTSDFQKLIGPSPTGTTQMPRESPGKVGNWVGWQIIDRFMEQHPEVTPTDLLALKDAQDILTRSKYRPRK